MDVRSKKGCGTADRRGWDGRGVRRTEYRICMVVVFDMDIDMVLTNTGRIDQTGGYKCRRREERTG